jgi:hypothetical protein
MPFTSPSRAKKEGCGQDIKPKKGPADNPKPPAAKRHKKTINIFFFFIFFGGLHPQKPTDPALLSCPAFFFPPLGPNWVIFF